MKATLYFSLTAASLVAAVSSFAAEASGLKAETRDDFQWFSGLGFPDPRGSAYARVARGIWHQNGDDPPQGDLTEAFLLATNGTSFRVLTLDLFDLTLTNTDTTVAAHWRVGFEVLDWKAGVAERLRPLRDPTAKQDPGRRFGERLSERAELFTLAWGCWRNGLDAEAQQLCEQADKMTSRRGWTRTWDSPNATFRQKLEDDLAYAMMWRAIEAFTSQSESRPRLLTRFEAITTNYPHSDFVPRAKQTARVLKRMIEEDDARARLSPTNLAELPVEQQVREWIFRLRDQPGWQWTQPGWCDILDEQTGGTNTAAHQLVKVGYAAVPQLIAALGDPGFSRAVGFHRNFHFSHTVLTVGDCALAVLERIAGRRFLPEPRSGYMSAEGTVGAARQAAEAWWAECEKKGEKEMLIEAVASASRDAAAQAEILCQRYPAIAAATLIQGARAATEAEIRTRLVEQVSRLDEPQVTEFLNSELSDAPMLETRVAAAYGLRNRGRTNAVWAMIRDWEKLAGQRVRQDSDARELVEFLAGADSVPAVQALGRGFRDRPVWLRMEVVEGVGQTNSFFCPKAEPRSAATLDAIEELLVTALDDQQDRVGASGSFGDKHFPDPRICDLAGQFLAERWPSRYDFDIAAPLATRDRQRIECMNTWRRAHHLPDVPLPQPPARHVRPEEATLVTTVEWVQVTVKASERVAAMIEAFKDQPLEVNRLVGFLTAYAARPETQAGGIDFKAIKDEDLTGIRVMVRLLPGTTPAESPRWEVSEHVRLDRRSLYGTYGSSSGGGFTEVKDWDDFAAAVATALAAEPSIPFEIRVRLFRESSE